MTRVAFLVQLPEQVSPGQRFRIEQFKPSMDAAGIRYDTFSFLGTSTYRVLYQPGNVLRKILGVAGGFLKRAAFLFKASRYDYIFLQREAAPLGPPVFEWILAKLLRKKLILDFDDAIWIPNTSKQNSLASGAKCFWKVKYLCKWAYKVSVGNEFLRNYARQYNDRVILIPTCVDTRRRYDRLKDQLSGRIVIGWTGSHSTLMYLDPLVPVLERLEKKYDFDFLVICNRPPDFKLKSLRFLPWNEVTEIDDLLRINIGIMPLVRDAWSEGKCGFKLIQYLALGMPAVASPVGVNNVIIEEARTGYLCGSEEEWEAALSKLIEDGQLRMRMGIEGREKIVAEYSLQANEASFVALFS